MKFKSNFKCRYKTCSCFLRPAHNYNTHTYIATYTMLAGPIGFDGSSILINISTTCTARDRPIILPIMLCCSAQNFDLLCSMIIMLM